MSSIATSRARTTSLAIAAVGVVVCIAAVVIAATQMDGYVHASYPVAVLGARGVDGAGLFNAFAFVLPGVCAALCAWRWRAVAGAIAPWPLRIGAHMLVLAGLAFAAQGMWTLDLDELDGGGSRAHATAWMLWCVAATAGGVFTSLGLAMRRAWGGAIACLGLSVVVLATASGWLPIDAGHAQRAGFAAWGAMVMVLASMRGWPDRFA